MTDSDRLELLKHFNFERDLTDLKSHVAELKESMKQIEHKMTEMVALSAKVLEITPTVFKRIDELRKDITKHDELIVKLQKSEEKFKELQDGISSFKKLVWGLAASFAIPMIGMALQIVMHQSPQVQLDKPDKKD